MRAATILILCAIIAIVALSGCGGRGIPYHSLEGDFLPTALGTRWNYQMDVTTYYGNQTVTASEQSTRQVTDVVPGTGGSLIQIATITDDFPEIAVPDVGLDPASRLGQYLGYLFSSTQGGLRDWNEYFASYDTDGDGIANHTVRTASGPPTAIPTPVSDNRPFLRNPVITGRAATHSVPLTTIPFYSNNDTLSGTTTNFKVQYRLPENIAGTGTDVEWVTCVQTMQATINFQGEQGACTGTVNTDVAANHGPVMKDIDLEFRLAGSLLRFHIVMDYIP